MWEKLKGWAWAIVLALFGLLAIGRKPKWVAQKEKEIEERDQDIAEAQRESDNTYTDYEEVKANHDEAIEQAQNMESRPDFTNPDNAASFIDDVLGKRK